MSTKVYLRITRRAIVEASSNDDDAKTAKLWYQGGGFDVYVIGTLSQSDRRRHEVSYAALLAIQALGGKPSQLRDVLAEKRFSGRKKGALAEAHKRTKSMFE